MKDKQLEEYYSAYFDLFASKGWKQLVEQLEVTKSRLNDTASIKDAPDLHFRQGQLDVVNVLLTMEVSSRQAVEAIEAEESA